MDLLDNIATELGFEFHLYIVRDQLFGSKKRNVKDFILNKQSTHADKKVPDGKHDGHKSSNMAQSDQQQHPPQQHQQQQSNQQLHESTMDGKCTRAQGLPKLKAFRVDFDLSLCVCV